MRSLTETARATAFLAERPASGSGLWRKARKRLAASVTTSRRGENAGINRPQTMPAIEACTPEATVANQTSTVTSAYGQVRQTPNLPRRARVTTPARASATAAALIESA